MRHLRSFVQGWLWVSTLTVCVGATTAHGEPVFQVVHHFDGVAGGGQPGALTIYQSDPRDRSTWALYGTTNSGGGLKGGPRCENGKGGDCGIVFTLAPPTSGSGPWIERRLYVFQNGIDGRIPDNGALSFDRFGALYGTTVDGGFTYEDGTGYGEGILYKLAPPRSAGDYFWRRVTLQEFSHYNRNGYYPQAPVTLDQVGTLYFTTASGPRAPSYYSGYGTVDQYMPPGGVEPARRTTIHRFSFSDGAFPSAPLLRSPDGVLFGTTYRGGPENNGTVFSLVPPIPGQTEWVLTTLNSFRSSTKRGAGPVGGLVRDLSGALYGMTQNGGTAGAGGLGVVYRLVPPTAGSTQWVETPLLSFNGPNGATPTGGLIADASDTLYGTTRIGGKYNGGVVFKLTPPAPGATDWTETLLHEFKGGRDGSYPESALAADTNGDLYGTTANGGVFNKGTAFRISGAGFLPR